MSYQLPHSHESRIRKSAGILVNATATVPGLKKPKDIDSQKDFMTRAGSGISYDLRHELLWLLAYSSLGLSKDK